MDFLSELTLIEIVYWVSAVVGGILFLFRAALFFIGGGFGDLGGDADFDGDFDGDVDIGSEADFSFKLLSLQGLTAFFMMFGLGGLAIISTGVAPAWSVLGGMAIGLFTVFVLSMIYNFFIRLQSEGTLNIQNAVGREGSVYLRIPATGSGQVQVSVQGGLKIFDARAAGGQEVPTGAAVKVVGIQGSSTLIVEPLEG